MRRGPSAQRRGERGAVLVQVAVAMVALTAFSAVVIDYGLFWVSRRQAQNAADAGALAGAQSLAFEDTSPTGLALDAGRAAAQANVVWGATPRLQLDDEARDVRVERCPGDDTENNCLTVHVERSASRGNPLPTFFARLVRIEGQDVVATATAEALPASTSDCLKPWAVADRWDESAPGGIQAPRWDPDWTLDSTFVPADGDVYRAPTAGSPGTTYRMLDDGGRPCCDYGRLLRLNQRAAARAAAWYRDIEFSDVGGSSADWTAAIAGCHTGTIGERLTVPGLARPYRPSEAGIDQVVAADPSAFWYNPSPDPLRPWLDTYNPLGVPVPPGLEDRCPEGCVYSPDTGINASPRIGTVAIVSPEDLAPCQDCEVTIRNIVGLFIDRHVVTVGPGTEQEISGRIVRVPGRLEPSATAVHQTASALRQIVLVR